MADGWHNSRLNQNFNSGFSPAFFFFFFLVIQGLCKVCPTHRYRLWYLWPYLKVMQTSEMVRLQSHVLLVRSHISLTVLYGCHRKKGNFRQTLDFSVLKETIHERVSVFGNNFDVGVFSLSRPPAEKNDIRVDVVQRLMTTVVCCAQGNKPISH